MNRRGLVTVIVLFTGITASLTVHAQQRTLAQRLAELRRGFGSRQEAASDNASAASGESANSQATPAAQRPTTNRVTATPPRPTRQQAPAATQSLSKAEVRHYPRVNSRQLLPNRYTRPVAGSPARQPEQRRVVSTEGAPVPRTAQRLQAANVSPPTSQPATGRSLGDAYLEAPVAATRRTRPRPAVDSLAPQREVRAVSGLAEERAASPARQQEAPLAAERPSASVRRSPTPRPRYEFDPEELRRDLVDSTGRPVFTHGRKSDDAETSAETDVEAALAAATESTPSDVADQEAEPADTADEPSRVAEVETVTEEQPLTASVTKSEPPALPTEDPQAEEIQATEVATEQVQTAVAQQQIVEQELVPPQATEPRSFDTIESTTAQTLTPVETMVTETMVTTETAVPTQPVVRAAPESTSNQPRTVETAEAVVAEVTPRTTGETASGPSTRLFAPPTDVVSSEPTEPTVRRRDTARVQAAGQQAFAARIAPENQVAAPPPVEEFPPASDPETLAVDSGEERQIPTLGRERFLRNSHARSVGSNVLTANRMPSISSHVSGPKRIMIGREAQYTLHLNNQSEVDAQEVVAQVTVPEWADVVDTVASDGIIQMAHDAKQPNTFRWQLHRLAAQDGETLDIKLVPRSSRPLELGIDWTYAPVGSRAVVEVQEPKLRMHVSGPDEVLYGKPQIYRLTLTNPGTGLAENVKVDLLPPGGGEETVSSHTIGNLLPGTSRSVEVELTAREAGKLFVKASAVAEGGITAEGAKEIFCRKPELEVDWRGPEQKYSGTAATYYFRVRNPGTAAADNVIVGVRLPKGVEFLAASDGQRFDPKLNVVTWRVGSLRPGDDYYMELKCLLNDAGVNSLDVKAATADGMLLDEKVAATNVIALADLKLEVSDPKGPIAVGQEAVYEIRVRNRGTSTAEQVNIVALFSEGIDARAVEGAQSSVADGRVTFRTIEKLAAGREVVLTIRASANRPGTHVFRAEVLCRDLEIKLAAEETTRFFADETLGSPNSEPAQSAKRFHHPTEDSDGSRY